MKKTLLLTIFACVATAVFAQPTFPQNGIADNREGYFAFTNVTVYTSFNKKIENATLVIHKGIVEAVGEKLPVPQGAATIDGKGKTIYPSFIDLMSGYGMPEPKAEGTYGSTQRPQMLTGKKGAYQWNEALKTEFRASDAFVANAKDAKELRDLGFGAVLTHRQDGISRGTASLVTLSDEPALFCSFTFNRSRRSRNRFVPASTRSPARSLRT